MNKMLLRCVIALCCVFGFIGTTAASTVSSYYLDTDSNHLYFDSIEFISGEKIVKGYSDGTYKPDQFINRAELLKIVVEAKYLDEFEAYTGISCFSDVPENEWFAKYICFAEAEGIIEGYSDGRFRPSQNINLVESLKIVLQVFGYDYPLSDPWYKAIVDQAALINIIPIDFEAFYQSVTRGQMADMIARMLKYESGELDKFLGEKSEFVVHYATLEKNLSLLDVMNEEAIGCDVFGCENEEVVKERFGCTWVDEVWYGEEGFVRCKKVDVSPDEVVVFEGGLLANGYTFLVGMDGDIEELDSVEDVEDYWLMVTSEKRALGLAMAVSGYDEIYSEEEMRELYGEDFVLAVEGEELRYSDPSRPNENYEVALYYTPTFGCSPFPVYEVVYSVSEDAQVEELESVQIGRIDSGYCVD